MEMIIALDGGGTKCDAVSLTPEGEVLDYEHTSTPGVSGRGDIALRAAIFRALRAHEPETVYIGIAGAARLPTDAFYRTAQRRFTVFPVSEWEAARCLAGCDHGAVILAGTGAVVDLAMGDGRSVWLDGSGPILGDFGAGYAIGMEAVRAAVKADFHDRHSTVLRDQLCEYFQVHSARSIHSANIFNRDRSVVAGLARFAIKAADAGDDIARHIIVSAALELTETYEDAVDRLGVWDEAFPLVGTGGVIVHSDLYWETILCRVADLTPRAEPIRNEQPAVGGVAINALQQYHGLDAAEPIDRFRREFAAYLERHRKEAS